jgi:hypothetical protein
MLKLRSNLRRILIITVALYLLFLDSISPGAFLVASLFMLAGQALQLASYAFLVKNTRITKEGPYAAVRHPFYVGTMLSDLGICLLSGSWVVTLVYMPVFSFIYFRRVLKEENFLINKFGREYREYARLTPRFLPRTRVVAQLRSSTYSVDPSLVFKNRVIPRILNIWAFFLAASELSDLRWGGDALWSMDHLVLLIECMALLLLAAFLDSVGKRLKKATAQAGIVPNQEALTLTRAGQDEPCIIEAGRMKLRLEGL